MTRDYLALAEELKRYDDYVESETHSALVQRAEAALREAHADKAKIEVLESLRPMWAQGYSDDSVAAQLCAAGQKQLWDALGVQNQTDAMQKVKALQAEVERLRALLQLVLGQYPTTVWLYDKIDAALKEQP